jgi:hypothetical protein
MRQVRTLPVSIMQVFSRSPPSMHPPRYRRAYSSSWPRFPSRVPTARSAIHWSISWRARFWPYSAGRIPWSAGWSPTGICSPARRGGAAPPGSYSVPIVSYGVRVSPDGGTAPRARPTPAGTVQFTTYDFADRPLRSGVGTATFSTLNPDATSSHALETTQANWREIWIYDAKPSANDYPWSCFSTQISGAVQTNLTGKLSAVASLSSGAWQVTLYSYDADGRGATQVAGPGSTTTWTSWGARGRWWRVRR